MSESRLNIKQFIRTGQFSKRLNLGKNDDESEVPETTLNQASRSSAGSSVSTTTRNSGLGVTLDSSRPNSDAIQTEDLIFLPSDLLTPTSLGPNGAYGAIPSTITYSASRGMSRISIPMFKTKKRHLEPIKETPQEHGKPPAYQSVAPAIPVISPPPNFNPVRTDASLQLDQLDPPGPISIAPRDSHVSHSSTIRTSVATEFEASTPTTTMSEGVPPLPNPQVEKVKFSEDTVTPSWPLPSPGKGAPNTSSLPSYSPYFNSPHLKSGHSSMQHSASQQSRFSWHLSKKDHCSDFFTRWFIEWWALEILSCAFSAVCMAIIVIVLLKYEGQELPKWKLHISINAFIAIFSGFAKSALLVPTAQALGQLKWNWFSKSEKKMMDFEILDSASRGPWGSLMLLTRTKGITLVSVGAAIIFLSLPFDLFFQQIVEFPTVWVESGNATIQRSILYAPPPNRNSFNGTVSLGADYDLQAGSVAYVWGQGDMPQTIRDCPTSNCTFPEFESLSICSSCSAMPTLLETGCYNTTGDWLPNVSIAAGTIPNITACGWFWKLPDRVPILMTGYRQNQDGVAEEAISLRMVPMADLITRKPLVPGGSINFKNVHNPIVDFVVAAVEGGLSGAYQNKTPIVHECELHWCVKTFKSNVWRGELAETTSKPIELESNNVDAPWNNPTDYMPNFTLTLPDPFSTDRGLSTYGLNNVTARQTIQVWDNWLPSTLVGNTPSGPQLLKWQWRGAPYTRRMETSSWMPPNDVPGFVSNITLAMSNLIRRTVNGDSTKAMTIQGTAWSERTLVEIRWYYLSLPVVLLAASLIFLTMTIMRSSKDQETVGVWKTSVLPVLISDVGEEIQDRFGNQIRMGHTRKEAKDIKVKMYD